jgi:hypothetical protein
MAEELSEIVEPRRFRQPSGDLIDNLSILSQHTVELLRISATSMVIGSMSTEFTYATGTAEVTRLLDGIQLLEKKGPTWVCCVTGQEALSRSNEGLQGGSGFAYLTSRFSIEGAHAFPLSFGGEIRGAMTLYMETLIPPARYLPIAVAMASAASKVLALDFALERSTEEHLHLQRALVGRASIEQAKGVVAEHLRITPERAFAPIREHSRKSQRKVADVARDLVSGTLPIESLSLGETETQSRRSLSNLSNPMRI